MSLFPPKTSVRASAKIGANEHASLPRGPGFSSRWDFCFALFLGASSPEKPAGRGRLQSVLRRRNASAERSFLMKCRRCWRSSWATVVLSGRHLPLRGCRSITPRSLRFRDCLTPPHIGFGRRCVIVAALLFPLIYPASNRAMLIAASAVSIPLFIARMRAAGCFAGAPDFCGGNAAECGWPHVSC